MNSEFNEKPLYKQKTKWKSERKFLNFKSESI